MDHKDIELCTKMLRLRKRGKNIYEGLYLFELGDCEKLTERIADTWERERRSGRNLEKRKKKWQPSLEPG